MGRMNAVAKAEAHLQGLLEQKEGIEAEIARHWANAGTRVGAGNKTGAMTHLKIKKMKENRIKAIDTMIAQAQDLLRKLRRAMPASAAASSSIGSPFNEVDRMSAIVSRSLLPEVSEEELNAALREAEHSAYLRNIDRARANAAAEAPPVSTLNPIPLKSNAPAPLPGSAASYASVVPRTTLPALSREIVPGPMPVNPGTPMMSPYPVRIGGKSRKRRLGKSRRSRNKTTRRSFRRA